ncbi:hypothetical protein ETI06_06410 [Macrococcoides goetzii]|nr:hypothetical protein [Macrococcus goetzii]TDM40686.1 hypothetical protein ETI10_08610 [Macrococcus goetzii]TDM45276.1 hypothetical protein ETI08_07835 [Macrococcus goetzii]TDM49179.1 hypothetical protein ETI06_06410 [Macrococcus goetzii]
MKKWISILLMSVVLCACGKAEDAPEKVDRKPDIEVKVKPPVDKKKTDDTKKTAKKEKNSTKEKKEKNSTAITTKTVPTSRSYDTERYNLARTCLVTPGKEKEADCQDISHTSEYSKAWNNLTSEGYICKSGQCDLAVQTETEAKTIEKQEKVTNEQTSTVPITTEVIPAKTDKTTEPKTTEPTTEPPQTTESDEVKTTESKTTEQNNMLIKDDVTQQSRSAVQDNSDDNNQ